MMQGQRDLVTVGNMLLAELAPLVNAQQGIVYVMDSDASGPILKQLSSYADTREHGRAAPLPLERGPGRPVRGRRPPHPAGRHSRTTPCMSAAA